MEARDSEGVKKEEIARCIISPSVIALCLYRGHGQLHLCTAEQKKSEKEIKKKKKILGCKRQGKGEGGRVSVMTHTLPLPTTGTTQAHK